MSKIHTGDVVESALDEFNSRTNSLVGKMEALRSDIELIKQSARELSSLLGSDSESNASEQGVKSYLKSYVKKLLVDNEEDIWTAPVDAQHFTPHPFISIEERAAQGCRTKFITLFNLKGGVGKTTIASNLTAAFAEANYKLKGNIRGKALRVLAVDLDFQASMTERCMRQNFLTKFYSDKPTLPLRQLFWSTPEQTPLVEYIYPFVECEKAKIIPTDRRLDQCDSAAFCSQFFDLREMRFEFRKWFHRNDFLEKYDLVIFDCPPRKTVAALCALTASDFVFIPCTFDLIELHPVLFTVKWLLEIIYKLKLKLQIGGIILNRANAETKLSSAERNLLETICKNIETNALKSGSEYAEDYRERFPNSSPMPLDSFIPKRTGIFGEYPGAIPGAKADYFERIASEIYQKFLSK